MPGVDLLFGFAFSGAFREATEELEAKGIAVEPIRVDDLTGKRFTFFMDPDDLPLELYEA